ncbi:MAG: ATP-binding cassette domain-containing protein, partial [Bacteroidaceae bacterium]|nr:ATP-binding cassette domain-containing protein [Bacteroidaceae bacterium]
VIDTIPKTDEHDSWDHDTRSKQILTKLGITERETPDDQLPGGQAKRVALAGALISEPDLLILDEPTNHLDVEVTEWLEDYLTASRLTLLLVTHDRYMLDRVCNRIVEIDDFKAYSYDGSYSYYLEKRQERLDAEQSQRESDLNLYRTELDWMRRMPCARGTKARYRKESFHELEERLQTRRIQRNVDLDVKASYIGNKIFEIEHLNKSFGDKVILKDFSYLFSRYEKLGIVGDNGVGKSTFLKLLMGQIEPDSGNIGRGTTLKIGYYSQQGMEFKPDAKVIDVVTDIADHIQLDDGRSMSAGQFLQKFLFSPQTQHKYVYKLSGGEKRRLYLCTILMQNPNFLILDEPTNDLDIMTLQVLEEYIAGFKGCVIAVSHDRYFMDKVAQHLFVFDGNGKITDFPSSYSDYMEWKQLKAQEEKARAQEEEKKRLAKLQQSGQSVQQNSTPSDRPAAKKLSFKEKREMEQIELELEQLEQERTSLEDLMNSGTLPFDQLSEKANRIGWIIDRIDEITLRWMELSERA